jgi:hypothetical protein
VVALKVAPARFRRGITDWYDRCSTKWASPRARRIIAGARRHHGRDGDQRGAAVLLDQEPHAAAQADLALAKGQGGNDGLVGDGGTRGARSR